MQVEVGLFVWDATKERTNIQKHGVDFLEATQTFHDPHRKIFTDEKHSSQEQRFFCMGKVSDRILTVRFLYRVKKIRILGAGYWRQGRKYYEQERTQSGDAHW
jgi:uncharacterized protein